MNFRERMMPGNSRSIPGTDTRPLGTYLIVAAEEGFNRTTSFVSGDTIYAFDERFRANLEVWTTAAHAP